MDQDIPALRFANFKDKWQKTTLGDVSTITMGQSPKSSTYNNLGLGLPLIQGNADIKNRRSKPQLHTTQITKKIDENDVLLTVRAPVGHVALSDHKACIGRGVAGIKATNNTFMFYNLFKNENEWLRYSQGSTFTSINSDVIDQFPIKTPSRDEQIKIGNFFELLDENIKAKEKEINKIKDLKKAYMQQIFNQKLRFKNNENKYYADWEEKRLGEVAEIKTGYTPPTNDSENFGGSYIWYGITDFKNKYINKSKRTISEKGFRKNKLIKKGTLLMSFKLSIGELAITKTDCLTNEAIANFNWLEKIDTEFMYYSLKNIDIKKYGNQAVQGVTLNNESLNSIEIRLPEFEEQKKIGNFLSLIDEKINLKNQELEKIKKYKKAFLEKMFV